MKIVNKKEFYDYFKDKEFIINPGCIFHSKDYIVNDEIVGNIETSSWNTDICYKLKYWTDNSETTNFITNIIENIK